MRRVAGPPVSTMSSSGRSLAQTVRPAAVMSRSSAAASKTSVVPLPVAAGRVAIT